MRAVAFSPQGATIASAADDATVRLWDAADATCRLSVRFGERIVALAVSIVIVRGRAICCLVGGLAATRMLDEAHYDNRLQIAKFCDL